MLDQGSFLSIFDPSVYPRFVHALVGGAGAYNLFRGGKLLWFGDGSLHWPRVEGVIHGARVETKVAVGAHVGGIPIAHREGGYEVIVDYAYEVGGRTYTSDRWTFEGHLSFPREEEAERKVRIYREANSITVRYDPADPSRSVIKPGGGAHGLVVSLAGVAALLWALYGFLAS